VLLFKVSDHSYVVLINLVYRTRACIGIFVFVSIFIFFIINALPTTFNIVVSFFTVRAKLNLTLIFTFDDTSFVIAVIYGISKIRVRRSTRATAAFVRVVTHFITFNVYFIICVIFPVSFIRVKSSVNMLEVLFLNRDSNCFFEAMSRARKNDLIAGFAPLTNAVSAPVLWDAATAATEPDSSPSVNAPTNS